MPMIMQLDSTSWLDNLKSETSIIVAVFLLVGIYLLKSLPSIISSFKVLKDDGGRSDQLLSALLANTTAKVELKESLIADLHENRENRRHFHTVRNYLSALQGLLELLVIHLEDAKGKRLTKERTLLNAAGDILRDDKEE